jgi:hypothetical protein
MTEQILKYIVSAGLFLWSIQKIVCPAAPGFEALAMVCDARKWAVASVVLRAISRALGVVSLVDFGAILRGLGFLASSAKTPPATKITLTSIAMIGLLTGCASLGFLRSPSLWDKAQEACKLAYGSAPEAQAEATRRGLSFDDFAQLVCQISEVVEPWVVVRPATAAPDWAATESMTRAKAKGLVK